MPSHAIRTGPSRDTSRATRPEHPHAPSAGTSSATHQRATPKLPAPEASPPKLPAHRAATCPRHRARPASGSRAPGPRRRHGLWLAGALLTAVPLLLLLQATPAWAAPAWATPEAMTPIWAAPGGPNGPTAPTGPTISVSIPGQPSNVITIIVLTTVLGVAPAILLLCTSFTKIVVVLSLARSAIGTQSIPPNQVLVGLALFLSLFVMGPTLDQMNAQGVQPYLAGTKPASQAYHDASVPLREFLLKHTRDDELALMTKAAGRELPKDRDSVDMRTLVPAFVLSELRAAFIIGFVVFVPFLVVDLVVSAILMSLGMVMLPPSIVSLPFKLLLFVLVDGWTLIVTTLIGSYR